MKLEKCNHSDYFLLKDEFGIAVALVLNGEIKYRLYDRIKIAGNDNHFAGVFSYWDDDTYTPTEDDIGRIISFRDNPNECVMEVLIEKPPHTQRAYIKPQNIKCICRIMYNIGSEEE